MLKIFGRPATTDDVDEHQPLQQATAGSDPLGSNSTATVADPHMGTSFPGMWQTNTYPVDAIHGLTGKRVKIFGEGDGEEGMPLKELTVLGVSEATGYLCLETDSGREFWFSLDKIAFLEVLREDGED